MPDPETYAIQVVNFGDSRSQTIAMCALQKTARLGEKDNPDAAKMISENSYMDDLVDSVASPEDAERLSNEVDEVLKRAGFRIKEWVISGDQHEATEGDDGMIEENVLGIKWNVSNDEISCKTKIYGSKLLDPSNPSLTKRKILSYINGIYDPLGIVAPVTIKAKLMICTLWTEERNLKLDDPIPSHIEKMWMTFFGELCRLEEVKFKRCIKPKDAVGKPELILFSDGSKESYGAAAYARWVTTKGTYKSALLASKNRVAPAKTVIIVRLELCGAVLSKRLRMFIMDEARWRFQAVYHLIDSQIVNAMSSYGFNTFVANRIGEIQEKTEPDDWMWIPSKVNVADWLTRPKKWQELTSDSVWQQGPKFLENRWKIGLYPKSGPLTM